MIIKNGDIRNIALLTGDCGTGKSTVLKHDIKDCYEHTADTIVIIDLYGEYTELVKSLGGTEIMFPHAFNPFHSDMSDSYIKAVTSIMVRNLCPFVGLRAGCTGTEKDMLSQLLSSHKCDNMDELREAAYLTKYDRYKGIGHLRNMLDAFCEEDFFSKTSLAVDTESRIVSFNLREVPFPLLPIAYIYSIDIARQLLSKENKMIRLYLEDFTYLFSTNEMICYFSKLVNLSKKNHEIIVFVDCDLSDIKSIPDLHLDLIISNVVILVFHTIKPYFDILVEQGIIPHSLASTIDFEIINHHSYQYAEIRGKSLTIVPFENWS